MGGHLAAEARTSKSGGTQGCTISLYAAVHLRCMPRALLVKKKKNIHRFICPHVSLSNVYLDAVKCGVYFRLPFTVF